MNSVDGIIFGLVAQRIENDVDQLSRLADDMKHYRNPPEGYDLKKSEDYLRSVANKIMDLRHRLDMIELGRSFLQAAE